MWCPGSIACLVWTLLWPQFQETSFISPPPELTFNSQFYAMFAKVILVFDFSFFSVPIKEMIFLYLTNHFSCYVSHNLPRVAPLIQGFGTVATLDAGSVSNNCLADDSIFPHMNKLKRIKNFIRQAQFSGGSTYVYIASFVLVMSRFPGATF